MTDHKLNRPIPPKPDIKLYKHLSEKERMLAGFPYKANDPQLEEERMTARMLIEQFNALRAANVKERRDILENLLHPDCKSKKLFIEAPFCVDYGSNLKVGNNFYCNFDCVFLDSAMITIGDNALLGPGVHIYAADHPLDPTYRQDNEEYYDLAYPVKIGNNCWIGGKAIICPGVTIGDNVVIGAGAVVVKDIPSNVVVAGNPAKVIRNINIR